MTDLLFIEYTKTRTVETTKCAFTIALPFVALLISDVAADAHVRKIETSKTGEASEQLA